MRAIHGLTQLVEVIAIALVSQEYALQAPPYVRQRTESQQRQVALPATRRQAGVR